VLERVEATLRGAGTGSPELEAKWIVEAATNRHRSELLLDPQITSEDEADCHRFAARRAAGEPLQYVTSRAAFRGVELTVGPGVFIPRPETELVAERAMAHLPYAGRVVDVGTGSGAIALAISAERTDACVFGTESSPLALAWAQENRELLGKNVDLLLCDLLDGLPRALEGAFDVVVSNPPYIDPAQLRDLPSEVRDHEPHTALFAGERGLDVTIRLADAALRWLKPQGWLVLEIGSDQAQRVVTLLGAAGFDSFTVKRDLAGRDRIAEGQKP
jgi:release factor glutamine methyltransferase